MFLYILAAVILALAVWGRYKPTLYDVFDDALKARAKKIKFPKYKLPVKCVVTGGSGFLGQHLVEALVEQGCQVTVFDIREGTPNPRVKFIKGDLVKQADVLAAFQGAECVFHVASPAHDAKDEILTRVNVEGTRNVVQCCLDAKVPRLVFTSSASVVYAGTDQVNADEASGYPAEFRDTYARTKALAEQVVLNAAKESRGRLSAVSVRPHGLFGPRDPTLVPTLVKTCQAGKLKFAIGTGETLSDFTYIGNVVQSHLLAAENAFPTSKANGKAYFITNNDPVSFWGFMFSLLHGLGYKVPSFRVPYPLMLWLARFVEALVSLASLFTGKKFHITFSSSRMQLCGTHHYYNMAAAKSELGYVPLWGMKEGLYLTLRAFKALRNPKAPSSSFQDELEEYTVAEVAKHNNEKDAWLIIDGQVYDITEYVDMHPGGDKILRNVGGDATEGFRGPQHPTHVFETVKRFLIGTIVDA